MNFMEEEPVPPEDELLLQAYLDGELPPDQHARFAARLERDPKLTAVLTQWRALTAELDALPEPQLTRDLTARVLARLESPAALPRHTWQALLVVPTALATLTLLLTWSLLTTWLTLPPLPPAWVITMPEVQAKLTHIWQTWWAAIMWAADGWGQKWTAVWQGLDQAMLSLSWLLPLTLVATLIWLVCVRFAWRSTPTAGHAKRLD